VGGEAGSDDAASEAAANTASDAGRRPAADGAPVRTSPGTTAGTGATDDPDAAVDDDARAALAELGRLSYYLDELFVVPGTRYRVGLDPLLGLLPGVGDVPTTVASAYVVARAAALGVPRATLARMVVVLLVDAVVGSLPLVGDAFDAVWKANARNVDLAASRLADPTGARGDRRVVLAVTVALSVLLLAASLGVGVGVWWLAGRVGLG
jgi:hypothetical protein